MRLYEIEEVLNQRHFVRISNSEIVNLRQVIDMNMNLRGTIQMNLQEGIQTFVSRRYVPKIKQQLGL